jgi:hypothetical protein
MCLQPRTPINCEMTRTATLEGGRIRKERSQVMEEVNLIFMTRLNKLNSWCGSEKAACATIKSERYGCVIRVHRIGTFRMRVRFMVSSLPLPGAIPIEFLGGAVLEPEQCWIALHLQPVRSHLVFCCVYLQPASNSAPEEDP